MNENIKRLKGAKDLVFDAVEETTNLVERMHSLAGLSNMKTKSSPPRISSLGGGSLGVLSMSSSGEYKSG